jgi:hypothetical protein
MTAFTLGPQFEPQTDLIAAALSVPLHAVTKEHVGRKLRLMVQ